MRRREPESLILFLLSLAGDASPVGDQVRTFIVGDDLAKAMGSIDERIHGLKVASEYEYRHSRGREVAVKLNFIIDSIERLVLPADARAAFGLLVALFEADGVAMENCGEHHWTVQCAYERAMAAMEKAAIFLPREYVEKAVRALMEGDGYGVRTGLAAIVD